MLREKSVVVDNEYSILLGIVENKNVTQRELSKILGVSVSTVNILINKMIREGLIKMTQVSQKQVLYMLTPAGMVEKARKTMDYLKIHYKVIHEMKEKIKNILIELSESHDRILVLMSNNGLNEVVSAAVNEYMVLNKETNVDIIMNNEIDKIPDKQIGETLALIHMVDDIEELKRLKDSNWTIINLAEKL